MKNLRMLASACAVLGAGAIAFASTTATTTTAPAAAKTAVETAKPAAATETLTGKIASVNTGSKTFKLTTTTKDAAGKETTKEVELGWADATRLAWKNEKSTAATATDLKAGAEVTVEAETKDGKLVASEIWFHPAPAAQPATK